MDLIRAVIIGLQGTPNGLFFFDVFCTRASGLGINPNLYKCGKVQLSLAKSSGGQETMLVFSSSYAATFGLHSESSFDQGSFIQ
ncbi:ubiquitin-conjugating enzyme family protein [Artemisia annua]|uniref:Ubiquitin-conjugating enzyme family protein n=1 Tax=Artemisia annua TaxID=35608 RepID=A0A2U1M2M8_ARTAN|nr:ubiquitin-conjugating enzyme family protein [Artemisia annua]